MAKIDRRVVAGHFRDMAEQVLRDLPMYRRICEAAVDDDEVLDLVATARPMQARPVLLLAAVHDVLLAGAEHPLAAWYPSSHSPGGSPSPPSSAGSAHELRRPRPWVDDPRPVGEPGSADDPWPAFRDLALSSADVAASVATRATQTNEVNRCGVLLPAFSTVASAVGGERPLGLVELGASAGLNLLFDRYSYDYGEDGRLDPPGGASPVQVQTQRRGPNAIPVPPLMPAVGCRSGIDLNPVDIADPAAARWLVACVWPEQIDRLRRVRAAIELARAAPPELVQGDLVTDLPTAVERVPADHELVLFTTWVLTYLSRPQREALTETLDAIGGQRDLHLIYGERLEEVAGLPQAVRPDRPEDDRFTALVWLRWKGGHRTATRLGDLHPHGLTLDWCG